jgi:pimeloyl-ACP methyl ester carboxylesterase
MRGEPPAGETAPRQDSVLSISKQGFHRVAYTEWGDPASDQVVVCVHGLTRQGRDFDPLAIALVRRGYRVICPDLVGRGRSEWLQDPDDYALPQYATDMTVLLARTGAKAVTWVGTSLGALVGMTVASQSNSPIRRMVVNDIGPFVSHNALHRLGLYLRTMPARLPSYEAAEAYFRGVLASFGELDDAGWRLLTQHSIAQEADGSYRILCDPGIARAFRPALFYNVSMWRHWDAIEAPVLLIRGADSDLLSESTAETMRRRGPRPDFVEIPGVGHAPALLDEDQIDIVVNWIGDPS